MFPIFSDAGKFRDNGAKRITLLRPSEQTRIEELQPYNTWNPAIYGSGLFWQPQSRSFNPFASIPTLLDRLNTLDNIDKHRTVHPVWQAVDVPSPRPTGGGIRGSTVGMQGFENDAEIGRWNFDSSLPDISSVNVKGYFPIGIAIGEPALSHMAFSPSIGPLNRSLLEVLLGMVADVIGIFLPCFGHGAPPPRPLR